MARGIFVGHHDRTGAVLRVIRNGVVRGKSWARQLLNDVWDATNWEWQMVALELIFTKKVTSDKEGAGLLFVKDCS